MTVPVRTEDQRAMEVRHERAELRRALKSGRISGVDIIRSAGMSGEWHGVRIRWLLESLPRIGPARADSIMRRLAVAETRRLGGITDRQRQELIEAIEV